MVVLSFTARGTLMAFDLYGNNSINYYGKRIRFNIWTWHRICKTLEEIDPEIFKDSPNWFTNNGQFVDKRTAGKIVRIFKDNRNFASIAGARTDVPNPLPDVGDSALRASIDFELPFFIMFLENSDGFYIR